MSHSGLSRLWLGSSYLEPLDTSHVLMYQIPHRVSGRGEETYCEVLYADPRGAFDSLTATA